MVSLSSCFTLFEIWTPHVVFYGGRFDKAPKANVKLSASKVQVTYAPASAAAVSNVEKTPTKTSGTVFLLEMPARLIQQRCKLGEIVAKKVTEHGKPWT
jgi:predicted nucleic acid binding AN1-type Zn finger protein